MRDVNFITDEGRFNFRVAGYITCQDKMLVQRADGVEFFNLIGGRVKLNESTLDAFAREIKEELGLNVENPELYLIAENFYNWQNTDVHELLYVYHIELPEKYLTILDNFKILDQQEYSIWVEKSQIGQYYCLPEFTCELPELEKRQLPQIRIVKEVGRQ